MKCSLPAIFLLAASMFAQTGTDYDPLAVVGSFLQLTDSQIKAIRTNNTEFDEWSDSKRTRILELYDEIDLETRRDVPDPNALGIRYVDIEYIHREIDTREVDTRRKNESLLTEHQKVGLQVLETAAKLEPFAYAAWSVNLLNPDELETGFDVSSGRQTGLSPKARIRPELSLAPERAGRLRMWDRSRRLRVGRVNPSPRP